MYQLWEGLRMKFGEFLSKFIMILIMFIIFLIVANFITQSFSVYTEVDKFQSFSNEISLDNSYEENLNICLGYQYEQEYCHNLSIGVEQMSKTKK